MSHELVQKRVVVSVLPTPTGGAGGPVAFTSTGDKFIYTPAVPIDVYRWGFVTDALLDVGVGFVIALDHRPTAGSDTGRVEKQVMTFTADVAAGKVRYNEPILPVAESSVAGLGETNQLINVGPAGPFEVDPGEELVIEVTDAADTAGTGYVFIEYAELTAQGTRNANATKVAS